MKLRIQPLWAPRRGCPTSDWEDAVSPVEPQVVRDAVWRGAVADGASEAAFAGPWARMLVEAVSAGELPVRDDWGEGFPPLRSRWEKFIADKGELPWFADEKVRKGSFATLLGLQLERTDGLGRGMWYAGAVGDSCMFQVRGDQVLASFPLSKATDFGNHPRLVNSRQQRPGWLQTNQGEWLVGDRFYLMTDALACWFCESLENGSDHWRQCAEPTDAAAFAAWVDRLRGERRLRDDDCTLLHINVEADDDPGDESLAERRPLQRGDAEPEVGPE